MVQIPNTPRLCPREYVITAAGAHVKAPADLTLRGERPPGVSARAALLQGNATAAVLGLALALLCLPLASFAAVGWFSRYAADDYCTASQVVSAGLLQAQSRLYVNWSGRFSATLFNTLLETVGVRDVPFLAGLALVSWVAATAWAIRQLARAFGWRLTTLASATLAALLVYATLDITADLSQDVYWQTGLVTYLLPLVLAALFVGWLARSATVPQAKTGAVTLAVPFVLALLAGGTSETFAAAQVTALVLALAIAIQPRSRVRSMLFAGLVGALIALAIVALAPGNEVRQETSSRTPLLVALPEALDFTRLWLRLTFARPHAVVLTLLLLLPATVAALQPRSSSTTAIRPRVALPALLVGVGIVVFACILPAFYALGSNPPGRAQLIPEFVLLATVGVFGWCVGAATSDPIRRALHRWPIAATAAAALVILLLLGPLLTTGQSLAQLAPASMYATDWDRLDAQIRADRNRGIDAVTVPPLPSTGAVRSLAWVGPDRTDWFNQCVAGYYGVSSIAASPAG